MCWGDAGTPSILPCSIWELGFPQAPRRCGVPTPTPCPIWELGSLPGSRGTWGPHVLSPKGFRVPQVPQACGVPLPRPLRELGSPMNMRGLVSPSLSPTGLGVPQGRMGSPRLIPSGNWGPPGPGVGWGGSPPSPKANPGPLTPRVELCPPGTLLPPLPWVGAMYRGTPCFWGAAPAPHPPLPPRLNLKGDGWRRPP